MIRAEQGALRRALEGVVDAAQVPSPSAEQLTQLWRFAELVSQWGARTDLVAARSHEALAEVLFLDALVLSQHALVPEGHHIVDVGAGAGAPTLPLALVRGDVRATLVEPRRRRVAFLRIAVGTLGLARRLEVIEGRAEDLTQRWDTALSRATFEPEEWLVRAAALAPRALVLLGRGAAPEIDDWERGAEREYRVPTTGARRVAQVFRRR